jgi:ABC-type glycerol-3-phosphate transport system substrate-binding protein
MTGRRLTRRLGRRARWIAALAAVGMAGLTLTGCSTPGSASDPAAVTYMTWESIPTNTAFDTTMAKFTKESGIRVERSDSPNADYAQKLASLMIARKAPDFFWCTTAEAQNLADEGLLYDWTSKLRAGEGLQESQFSPGALASWTTPGGRVAGIPTLANTYGFFYNADTFRKDGIPVPAPGWTWDDLFSAMTKLKAADPGTTPLVNQWPLLDSPQGVSAYSVANGGKPFVDDFVHATSVSTDATFEQGAKLFTDAIRSGEMTNPDYDPTNVPAAFSNGAVPLMFAGQFVQQFIAPNKPKFDWGYAPWPAGDTANVQPVETNGICSPSTLQHPEATWKAISYLESTGFNDAMRAVPVAPIAYMPGTKGYYAGLTAAGDPASASIAATAKYELAAKDKFITAFLDPWATNATDIVTTQWNPMLSGHGTVDGGIADTADGIRRLMG